LLALSTGVSLKVVDEGAGRPVVLLHGVCMSSAFFGRQRGHLEGVRIVAPDFRGHGDSEKVLSGHTVRAYAEDLRGLFEVLSVSRPILVGWSMGSMVALEYLEMFGSVDVAGLVIVDQPPSDFKWPGYAFGLFDLAELDQTSQALQTNQAEEARAFAELMLKSPSEEDLRFMAAEIMKCPPAIASSILLDQSLRDYRSAYAGLEVPTLVVFGRDAKLTDPAAGEWIARELGGARLEIFEESGHCPFYEEPERFNSLLAEFVAGHD